MAEPSFQERLDDIKQIFRAGAFTKEALDDELITEVERQRAFVDTTRANVFGINRPPGEVPLPIDAALLKSMIENTIVQAKTSWQQFVNFKAIIRERRAATSPAEDPTLKPGEKPRTPLEELGREAGDAGVLALLGFATALSPVVGVFDTLGITTQQGFLQAINFLGIPDPPLPVLADAPKSISEVVKRQFTTGPFEPSQEFKVSDLIGAVATIPDVIVKSLPGTMLDVATRRFAIRAGKQISKRFGVKPVAKEAAKEATEAATEAAIKKPIAGEKASKTILDEAAEEIGAKPEDITQLRTTTADIFESTGAKDIADNIRTGNIGKQSTLSATKPRTISRATQPNETLREAMQQLAARIETQRRGTRPPEVTSELGRQIREQNPDLVDRLRELLPGSMKNPEDFDAIQQALEPLYQQLGENAAGRAAGDPQATAKFIEALEQLVMVKPGEIPVVAAKAGVTAEAGRLLQIHSRDQVKRNLDDLIMRNHIEEFTTPEGAEGAMRAFAAEVAEVWEETGKAGLAEATTQIIYSGRWAQAKEIYRGLLLALPATAAFNAAGVGQGMAMAVARDEAAAFLGALRIAPNAIGRDDITQFTRGMAEGFEGSMKTFQKIVGEQGPIHPGIIATRIETMSRAVPGKAGTILRAGPNILAATDIIAQNMLRTGEARRLLAKSAVNAGIDPTSPDFERFIQSGLRNLPLMPKIFSQSNNLARRFTFNSPLGPYGKMVQQFIQNSPVFFTSPFFRTLVNFAKMQIELTPGVSLGSRRLWRMLQGSEEDQARATAEIFMGQAFAITAFDLIQTAGGRITGKGPVDPELNELWKQKGNIPHSAFGLDLRRLEPAGRILDSYASFLEIAPYLDDDDLQKGYTAAIVAFGQSLFNGFFAGDALELAGNIKKAINGTLGPLAKQLFADPAITVATGGPIGAAIKNSSDEIVREYDTVLEELAAKTPFVSKSARGKRNKFGELVIRPKFIGGPIARTVFGVVKQAPEVDELSGLLLDLRVDLKDVPDVVGGEVTPEGVLSRARPAIPMGMNLTGEDKNRILEILSDLSEEESGLNVRGMMEAIRQTDSFKNATNDTKADMLSSIHASFLDTAVKQFEAENAERITRAIGRSRVDAAKSRLTNPIEKVQLEQEFNQLLNEFQQGNLTGVPSPGTSQ